MKIGKFIKQYKGKDLSKVPLSKLEKDNWYVGIKYDGNYCQIHKKGQEIWMFTSSGKRFAILELIDELLTVNHDFIIEAEFNNNSTGLKLNDRKFSSTGTARSNFEKNIPTSMYNSQLRVFDVLYWNEIIAVHNNFCDRKHLLLNFDLDRVKSVKFIGSSTLDYCKDFSQRLIKEGSEGAFAFHSSHIFKDKGRSNLAIKIKADNKKIMKCIGVKPSETVDWEIGSLILEDEKGLFQPFGGLSSKLRTSSPIDLIGKNFEVRYENFSNGKYIQGFISEN